MDLDSEPDFSGSDPDFRPIRIRTQEKSLIRIRKKLRIRNNDSRYRYRLPLSVLAANPSSMDINEYQKYKTKTHQTN